MNLAFSNERGKGSQLNYQGKEFICMSVCNIYFAPSYIKFKEL